MRRPVVGYEGLYEVDSSGRVFGVERVIDVRGGQQQSKTIPSRELAAHIDRRGYAKVVLSREGSSRKHAVHRIVLMAFAGPPDPGQTDGNHKNGVRSDNRIENLEWVTRSENHVHKFRVLGSHHPMTGKTGAEHHRSIPIIGSDPKSGQAVASFDSLMSAARAGYDAGKISMCISGSRKTHRGLVWSKVAPS